MLPVGQTFASQQSCTNECVAWAFNGTANPPYMEAEWLNNTGGWSIRGVAHCADGRNEQLYTGGWVTSLDLQSKAKCQSPFLDEIGGAYDTKPCGTCSFTRHWKVGHIKLTALVRQMRRCTRDITYNRFVGQTVANFVHRCAHSGQVGAHWDGVMSWSTKSTGAAAVVNEPTSLPAVKADCVVVALYNISGQQTWRKVLYGGPC
jgi:hypothetical protein